MHTATRRTTNDTSEAETLWTAADTLRPIETGPEVELHAKAETTRALAACVGVFCLAAAGALTWAGWGPHLERVALFGVGVIAALVAALFGRITEDHYTKLLFGGTASLCAYEAIMSDTIGDRLVFVGLAGVPAWLLLGIMTEDAMSTKLKFVCPVGFTFWCGGWVLFALNAPAKYTPTWWVSVLDGIINGVAFAIETVIGLVILAAFMAGTAARFVGRDPATIFSLNRKTRQVPTNPVGLGNSIFSTSTPDRVSDPEL